MKLYLSICALYRNEAPYLREWIEFHRLVGVERFFLYNNDSSDDHREVLAPYIADGTVVLRDLPVFPAQGVAYDDCLKRHGEESRWIAFIDLDEYLFSPTLRSVPEVLADYEEWPGVVVHWATFGTSGHRTKPTGSVIESYLRRNKQSALINRQIKSIVDPARTERCAGVHHFAYLEGFAVDENFERVDGSASNNVSVSKLRLNHYVTKSEEEYRRKAATARNAYTGDISEKRKMWRNTFEVRKTRLNAEFDDTITAYVPDLRKALALKEEVVRFREDTVSLDDL